MNILVACEYTGVVRDSFIAAGHNAVSCDLKPTKSKGPHIQGDVLTVLNDGWDMMIAFPPCTHLARSGARWFKEKQKDGRQQSAIDFFMQFVNAPIHKIAIENPVGIMSTYYRKPDQIIHPYMFGDPFSKQTCLWLKNLPTLLYTNIVTKGEIAVHGGKKIPMWYSNHKKDRDKTFPGIAEAMAQQWGRKVNF